MQHAGWAWGTSTPLKATKLVAAILWRHTHANGGVVAEVDHA